MQYMLLIYDDEQAWAGMDEAQRGQVFPLGSTGGAAASWVYRYRTGGRGSHRSAAAFRPDSPLSKRLTAPFSDSARSRG